MVKRALGRLLKGGRWLSFIPRFLFACGSVVRGAALCRTPLVLLLSACTLWGASGGSPLLVFPYITDLSCEQHLDKGSFDPKRQGVPHTQSLPRILKGNWVNILQPTRENVRWREGIRQCKWELQEAISFLFDNLFLT